jgi:hypothetical protein
MVQQIQKLIAKARQDVRKVTVLTNLKDIIERLFVIFKKHIGEENKISRRNLFMAVYGIAPEDCTELQEWVMWEGVRRCMHKMRQRTKCFVVSKCVPLSRLSARNQGVWNYWVANSMSDHKVYEDNINRNIKAMRAMISKCEKSIKGGWWKEEWEIK